jgi:acetoin utilization protein AcuB
MLVQDFMTRHPLLAEPTMSLIEAQRYMGENNVRHLPVVGDGKRLLGLVTRQTLLVDPHRLGSLDMWEIARTLSGLRVKDVMVKARDVVTVGPNVTLEEAAQTMVENKIGCLPVVEEGGPRTRGVVIGIITEIDLLAQLAEMMGGHRKAVRATVRMPDQKGQLAKLVAAISAQEWGILTLGGAPAPKEPEKWDAVVKIRNVPLPDVLAVLERVEGQQLVDIREV